MREPKLARAGLASGRGAEADPLGRGAPFRPWLSKIVANEAKSGRRSAKRHQVVAQVLARHCRSDAAVVGSAEAGAVASDERRELARALEQLTAKLRDVVVCRYFVGLSEEETTAALSIPAGTVKSRLSRALEKLEAQMRVPA